MPDKSQLRPVKLEGLTVGCITDDKLYCTIEITTPIGPYDDDLPYVYINKDTAIEVIHALIKRFDLTVGEVLLC